jgi:hypothetical protein
VDSCLSSGLRADGSADTGVFQKVRGEPGFVKVLDAAQPEALSLAKRSLSIREKVFGPDRPGTAAGDWR